MKNPTKSLLILRLGFILIILLPNHDIFNFLFQGTPLVIWKQLMGMLLVALSFMCIESTKINDREVSLEMFDQQLVSKLGFSFSTFGFLHDAISLRLAYSVADVFVAPSIMEAFGKTLAEAMACGTPVVCFDATRPRDIVDHMVNGYRAIPFESEDLARGIEWICQNQYIEMANSARNKTVLFFDNNVIANQYI